MDMITLSAAVDALADVLAWLVIAPAAAFVEWLRRQRRKIAETDGRVEKIESHLELTDDGKPRLDRHEEQMAEIRRMQRRQERYWIGDPDDPDDPGALSDLHDIKNQLEKKDDE